MNDPEPVDEPAVFNKWPQPDPWITRMAMRGELTPPHMSKHSSFTKPTRADRKATGRTRDKAARSSRKANRAGR